MRIVYVAKHASGGNDDELAIYNSLESLGHEVICIQEDEGHKAVGASGDFLLFHKWYDLDSLWKIDIPKVFWYFDLVTYPDPTLARRNKGRSKWMHQMVQNVDLGFCTDGDWVKQDDTGKLIKLTQGFAPDLVTPRMPQIVPDEENKQVDILFTGIQKGGGKERVNHVDHLKKVYNGRFVHAQGVYKQDLTNLISNTKIVIAPEGPATHNYWSNRVYNTLGRNGFLLHPWCSQLQAEYRDLKEIVFYESREDLDDKINYYLEHPEDRKAIRVAGLERTLERHTYTHRCQKLIEEVEMRLF